MNKYNYNIVYLFKNSSNIEPIEINKNEFIKKRIDIKVFSFITPQKTFYVRRNGLEFWTSY
jgi:hypothetical protein